MPVLATRHVLDVRADDQLAEATDRLRQIGLGQERVSEVEVHAQSLGAHPLRQSEHVVGSVHEQTRLGLKRERDAKLFGASELQPELAEELIAQNGLVGARPGGVDDQDVAAEGLRKLDGEERASPADRQRIAVAMVAD